MPSACQDLVQQTTAAAVQHCRAEMQRGGSACPCQPKSSGADGNLGRAQCQEQAEGLSLARTELYPPSTPNTHTHMRAHTHMCNHARARTHTHTHTHNVQPRDSVMGTSPALLMYLMDLFRAVSCSYFFLSTKVKTLYLPAPHLCPLVVAVWLLSCV